MARSRSRRRSRSRFTRTQSANVNGKTAWQVDSKNNWGASQPGQQMGKTKGALEPKQWAWENLTRRPFRIVNGKSFGSGHAQEHRSFGVGRALWQHIGHMPVGGHTKCNSLLAIRTNVPSRRGTCLPVSIVPSVAVTYRTD